MGAGHTVTALYEIVPRGGAIPGPDVDPLKYQTPTQAPAPRRTARNGSNETLTLKIRYKDPNGTESKLMSLPLTDREGTFSKASVDFRFAASVAEFGMILRDSPYRGKASVGEVHRKCASQQRSGSQRLSSGVYPAGSAGPSITRARIGEMGNLPLARCLMAAP